MNKSRLLKIIFSGGFVIFVGWFLILVLNKGCTVGTLGECNTLWIVSIASILGGIIFIEILLKRKNDRQKRQEEKLGWGQDSKPLSTRWMWVRSVTQVMLISLLSGASLLIQGAFLAVLFGVLTGVFLDAFVRGIINKLPVTKETK
jgi:hypothetical protein